MIAASAATDAETVNGYVSAFEAVGCDELIFFPSSSDPEQPRAAARGDRLDERPRRTRSSSAASTRR